MKMFCYFLQRQMKTIEFHISFQVFSPHNFKALHRIVTLLPQYQIVKMMTALLT